MKKNKVITCDICGMEIRDPVRIRCAVKGKKYMARIYKAPDGDWFAVGRSRFDMCGGCIDKLRQLRIQKLFDE